MQPTETASRSPLDKPLHQLTEDDISQLTREDCRRYLKEKGMRRPSWNKSQAIQQVISLKTLLEATPDSEAGETRKRLYIPRPDTTHPPAPANPSVSVKVASGADTRISVPANDLVPYRRHDPAKPDFPVGPLVHPAPVENDSASPRTAGAANEPVGQMTIFYCGKVNVYDDVPRDKALAIMQLAASPLTLAEEGSCDVISASWPLSCQLETPCVKAAPNPPVVVFPPLQTVRVAENCQLHREESNMFREDSFEGPTSRKASVQRYLEKRKDRFKNKRKVTMPSSGGLDVYVNHQISNEWNLSESCSPPKPRPPEQPARCSSVENLVNGSNISAALNDKDVQEC